MSSRLASLMILFAMPLMLPGCPDEGGDGNGGEGLGEGEGVSEGVGEGEWVALVYDSEKAPADNPLKGFMPYAEDVVHLFPHSMEFDYWGLGDLMNGLDDFNWGDLRLWLDDVKSRGHQAVMRVFIEQPSCDDCNPPEAFQYTLPDAINVSSTPYDHTATGDGSGRSPDYTDERLADALANFIAAFGAEFDGDPRLGFIQVGLLGHWGEWHTLQGDFPNENLPIPKSIQDRVLIAFDAAFNTTHVVVSQDIFTHDERGDIELRDIGLHHDDFANETLGQDHFLGNLQDAGLADRWKSLPIGGEVQPDVQDLVFETPLPAEAPEDYFLAVEQTHASWLLNAMPFENEAGGWDQSELDRAEEGAKKLGYEFFVSEVDIHGATLTGPLRVGIRVQNKGVAPFYYDWDMKLAALSANKATVQEWTQKWDLSSILPGGAGTEFEFVIDDHALAKGTYTLAMTVPNPMMGGKPVKFANAEQTDEWLDLGDLLVGAGEGEPQEGTKP